LKLNHDIAAIGEIDSNDHQYRLGKVLFAINNEVGRAYKKYGHYASPLEGLGAIRSEYREFEDAVQSRNIDHAVMEAMQVAATATRFIMEFGPKPENISN
jgi:hypothetical protein